MKLYKVLQGRINGVRAGGTIKLDDKTAKAFGKHYVEAVDVPQNEKGISKAPKNKQVKTAKKTK